jgi:hypothetical protein
MRRNASFKALLSEANEAITPLGIKNCHICQDKPLDSDTRCERTVYVKSRDTSSVDTSSVDKKVLYSFQDPTSLPYKVPTTLLLKPETNYPKLILIQKGTKIPVDSIHIDELPAPGIQCHSHPRTNLDPACPRDITHFKDSNTGREIGGVIHKGFPSKFLSIVKDNHDHFYKNAVNVNRGKAFQQVNHGVMAGTGFRQPNGATIGSGYSSYKPTEIRPDAVIDQASADRYVDNLFRVATVT